ncbi:MAG: hypothetical protein K2X81_15420 [Candidatus Obscuribacterales bacterium]|nr:hypothetical protein [Candidatus Obscuribacterales bacterium]
MIRFHSLAKLLLLLPTLLQFSVQLADAQVLKGTVEFSRSLPPVKKSLRVGTTFDEKNLPESNTTSEWYRIPSWLAGVWHRSEQVTNLSLGRKVHTTDEVDEHFGYQKDRKGDVWNYHNEPYVERHETDTTIEIKLVTLRKLLQSKDNQAVFFYQCTSMTVSKDSHKIISEYQQEEYDTFHKVDQLNIKCDCKARIFSAQGVAEQILEGHYSANLKSGFAAIDQLGDKDLRKDFNNFLVAQGLSDLVP